MKMADWADDDSDYDDEEEFKYTKGDANDDAPCEDDNIKVSSKASKKGQSQKMTSQNTEDDLQFLTEEIGKSNEKEKESKSSKPKDDTKEVEEDKE